MMQKGDNNTAAASSVEPDVAGRRADLFKPDASAKATTTLATLASVLRATAGADLDDGSTGHQLFTPLFSKASQDGRVQSRKHLVPPFGQRCAGASRSVDTTNDRSEDAINHGCRTCPRVAGVSKRMTSRSRSNAISTRNRLKRRPLIRLQMPIHGKQLVKRSLKSKGCAVSQYRQLRGRRLHYASRKPAQLESHDTSCPERGKARGGAQIGSSINSKTMAGSTDGTVKEETSPPTSSQSETPAPKTSRRRSKKRNEKGQKKIPGDGDASDDEEEPEVPISHEPGDRRSPNTYYYACPFFKSDPSSHMACRDTGYPERRKIKEHLKRAHYKAGHLPLEIRISHDWDDWYQYIVKDTGKKARALPNSEANFYSIVLYLIRESQQLEDEEAPCFGTRMLKLLQHAQKNPTETEKIVQGLAAILDPTSGPLATSNCSLAPEPLSVNPRIDDPVLDQSGCQNLAFDPCSRLEPGPVATNSFGCCPVESNDFSFLSVGRAAAAATSYAPAQAHAEDAEVYQLTPILQTPVDATESINEWMRSNDYIHEYIIPRDLMDDSGITQNARCNTAESTNALQLHNPSSSYAQEYATATATETTRGHDQVTSDFVDPRNLTQSHCLSDVSASLVSTDHFRAAPLPGHTNVDAMPAPTSLFAIPQRRPKASNVFAKRKRPRAESMENIMIPALDNRSYPLPTPSPSVCERPQHSSSLMTPLPTPFTAGTNCSVSTSSHMILVVFGTWPEIFTFDGNVSDSVDDFINWTSETFKFNFREFQDPNRCYFINSSDGILACTKENDLRLQLNKFWEGSIFFSKSIPWLWIDMPFCGTCICSRTPYRPNPLFNPFECVMTSPSTD
ncbi:hypothetical protein TWF696_003287 [Orbilia brochopaga]|uniref:Uncharacterized protein n=1 Tax=Orbilia brochopaga TaxID=3140254 RepID=A0AAV9TXT3_9PEZI